MSLHTPPIHTIADLLDRLGGVSADRVRYFPLPGTATEQDVIDIEARENKLCELVDGTLVEKPLGYEESLLAMEIGLVLSQFVKPRRLGWVNGPDGIMRVVRDQLRLPDVAFISRTRAPGGRRPTGPIADLSPDLAVEVLSRSNTLAEMSRKLSDYFAGGTLLVWVVDPDARTISVFTSPDTPDRVLRVGDVLDGGDVLPGFAVELEAIFACLDD